MNNLVAIKNTLNADAVKAKFEGMIGKKASSFISSVVTAVQNNELLQKASPESILMSAGVAASLDLPISPSLGMAAIVPYKGSAQFQLMYKGLIELCQRSGQFISIIDEVVYEGQLIKKNKFTGEYVFDEDAKTSDKVVGYMAYFELANGFHKTLYMTIEEVQKHAKRYSKSYQNNSGVWKDDFDTMARKTVLKQLLTKYAPKSVDIQRAITFDQAEVKGDFVNDGVDNAEVVYVDNEPKTASEQASEFVNEQTGELF